MDIVKAEEGTKPYTEFMNAVKAYESEFLFVIDQGFQEGISDALRERLQALSEKSSKDVVNSIREKTGVKLELASPSVTLTYNRDGYTGMYNQEEDSIYINVKSILDKSIIPIHHGKILRETLKHEIAHALLHDAEWLPSFIWESFASWATGFSRHPQRRIRDPWYPTEHFDKLATGFEEIGDLHAFLMNFPREFGRILQEARGVSLDETDFEVLEFFEKGDRSSGENIRMLMPVDVRPRNVSKALSINQTSARESLEKLERSGLIDKYGLMYSGDSEKTAERVFQVVWEAKEPRLVVRKLKELGRWMAGTRFLRRIRELFT